MTEKQQQVRVVTPERVVYDDQARFVVAPGSEGDLGILPGHAPLITALKAGRVRIKQGDAETGLDVPGGLLRIADNTVTVLTPSVCQGDGSPDTSCVGRTVPPSPGLVGGKG